MRLPHFPSVLVLSILATSAAYGQVTAGLIGRVVDASGAVIPNAQVTLTETSTNVHQQTISSSAGDYTFTALNPGTYRLDVLAPGFEHLSRTGITASVGQTVSADLTLIVGSDTQTIQVTGDVPLLQAAQSDIETHIPGAAVVAIPLNSRNFINLAQLAPGVSLPPGTVLPRINGGRPRTNEYLYDGISALQPEPGQVAFFPILDDIQEFTVEADNVPAEFGRFNGGVVNVATRAGSNQVHGSLFEFFRNEDLNARNYFAAAAPARKPEYRRNLYGATLGGPILATHGNAKLFAFAGSQGIKALIGRTVISTIPTLAERQGIFTGVSKIYNPATTTTVGGKQIRTEFPNDTITSGFDKAARRMVLPRAQCASHHTPVAEPMKNRPPLMELDATNQVSVMTHDDMRAGLDSGLGHLALVGSKRCGHVYDAFMERYDDEVVLSRSRGDVLLHRAQRVGVGRLQIRRGSDLLAIACGDTDIRAAGTLGGSPAAFRTDAVVAQHRDAAIVHENHRGSARRTQIFRRATTRDIQSGQFIPRIGDADGAAIRHMVSGERHDIEPRVAKRGEMARVGARRGDIASHLLATASVRNLQMTDGCIRRLGSARDARQPIIRVRLVEHQVSCEH